MKIALIFTLFWFVMTTNVALQDSVGFGEWFQVTMLPIILGWGIFGIVNKDSKK
jgi:hypothetical protein